MAPTLDVPVLFMFSKAARNAKNQNVSLLSCHYLVIVPMVPENRKSSHFVQEYQ